MNITEDYVSFEVAKLLREKGFEQDYYNYPVYWMNGNKPTLSFEGDDDFPYSQNECVAPSFSTVMKWLREVHHIFISINITRIGGNDRLTYLWIPCVIKQGDIDYPTMEEYMADSYEQAREESIKYCLTNLI